MQHAPGASLAPRINSLPPIVASRSLPLKDSYRTRAACDAHIVAEERSWRSGPLGAFGSEEFDAFIAITDQDFGVCARRWRRPIIWLRTPGASCVQSTSASLFSILRA